MQEYVSIEDIRQAYIDCCKHKTSTDDCVSYQAEAIINNYQLYADLNRLTYEIGPSKAFCVTRPKLREVFCARFRDRVVHHLLALKFEDILEGELTDSAFACRKGKGVLYGVEYVQAQMERVSEGYTREAWVLKCDLQGFFMSIDRKMLYDKLERLIRVKYRGKDIEWWLWLWKIVVLHDPTKNCVKVGNLKLFDILPKNKSLFTCGKDKGLPIGNLPSQLLANLLLSDFDKMMVSAVGADGGYGRYVDDFIVISRDRRLLHCILQEGRVYLRDELGLTLHPRKISLQRVSNGVRFIGTMIRPHRLVPNRQTVERLYAVIDELGMIENPTKQVLKRYVGRINSLMGLLAYCDSYHIRRKAWMMMPHKDRLYCKNMKVIKIMNKFKV